MSFLKKIKAFFFEAPPETSPAQIEIPSLSSDETLPAPQGQIIATCILCGVEIGSDDRTKELTGHQVHKRCFKRAQLQILQGKSLEAISEEWKRRTLQYGT